MKELCIYTILFLISDYSLAQMDIAFRNIEQSTSLNGIWNINVSVQQNYIVYFQVTVISNKEGKVYEARTNVVQLQSGMHSLHADMLQPVQELFVLPGWDYNFKDDQYSFDIKAISYPSNQQVAEYQTNFTFTPKTIKDTIKNGIKKIEFGGTAALNTQYSDAFKSDYSFAPDYVRFDLHPELSLFDIPFSADVFITTEQKHSINTIDNYVFRFDYDRFKEKLIEKLLKETDHIIQNKVPDKYAFLKKVNLQQAPYFYKNADVWKQQLKDPNVLKKIHQVEKLEQLKSVIKDPQIKKKIESIDAFRKKYNINNLEEIKDQVSQLEKFHYEEILKWTKRLNLDSISKLKQVTSILSCISASDKRLDSLYKRLRSVGIDSGSVNKLHREVKANGFNGKNLAEINDIQQPIKAGSINEFNGIGEIKEYQSKINPDRLFLDSFSPKALNSTDQEKLTQLHVPSRIDSLLKLKEITILLNDLYKADSVSKQISSMGIDAGVMKSLSADMQKGMFTNIDSLIPKMGTRGINVQNELEKYSGISSLKDTKQLLDLNMQYDHLLEESKSIVGDKKQLKKMMAHFDKIKDVEKINVHSLIENESTLKSLLSKYNILSRKELFFKDIKRLEFGTVYPRVSLLALNGVVIKGYNVEINPGKFYFSSFAGKADNFLLDTFSVSPVKYKKSVTSFGVGYGNNNETHFHVLYIFSKEKGIPIFDSTHNALRVPLANHILISDIGGLFFHKLVYIGNEFSYSLISSSYNRNEIDVKNKVYGFAQKTFIDAFIPKTNTKISVSAQYTDKNYSTLNTPFLFKDRILVEGKIEQPLAKNKLQLKVGYKYDVDSISKSKWQRNTIHSLDINMGLNIPKYPYVQVSYLPLFIIRAKNALDATKLNYTGSIILNSGYNFSFKKGKILGNVQVSYSNSSFNLSQLYYVGENSLNVHYFNYTSEHINTISIRQSFTLPKNTGIQYSWQLSKPSIEDTIVYKTISAELSCSWVLLKKSQNIAGVTYSHGGHMDKFGFFIQTSFPITKYVRLDLRLQKEQLNRNVDSGNENIHGITFRTQLRIKL